MLLFSTQALVPVVGDRAAASLKPTQKVTSWLAAMLDWVKGCVEVADAGQPASVTLLSAVGRCHAVAGKRRPRGPEAPACPCARQPVNAVLGRGRSAPCGSGGELWSRTSAKRSRHSMFCMPRVDGRVFAQGFFLLPRQQLWSRRAAAACTCAVRDVCGSGQVLLEKVRRSRSEGDLGHRQLVKSCYLPRLSGPTSMFRCDRPQCRYSPPYAASQWWACDGLTPNTASEER